MTIATTTSYVTDPCHACSATGIFHTAELDDDGVTMISTAHPGTICGVCDGSGRWFNRNLVRDLRLKAENARQTGCPVAITPETLDHLILICTSVYPVEG